MKLSTKGQYAVLALADLYRHSQSVATPQTVALSEISKRQSISLNYLEQLFSKLRKVGIVNSIRGHAGGYILAKPASEIHVLDIITAVDESIRTTRCQNAKIGCQGKSERCLTHHLWDNLGTHIESYLSGISLENVIQSQLPTVVNMNMEVQHAS